MTTHSAASFRDPAGFVFQRDGTLYRHVNDVYQEHYLHLVDSGLHALLVERGWLVPHQEVEPGLSTAPGAWRVLRPERLPFVSYAFEWGFGQLKDAALLTLDVLAEALRHGMILRDASAFNVQFRGSRPVFIDTLSFARYRDGQPWYAYRQFCEFFLAPLALMSRRDVRLGRLLREFPNGVPLDLASTLLDAGSRLRPSLLIHLHLHARAQRRFADADAGQSAERRLERRSLEQLVDHLRETVEGLDWSPDGTTWADYEATHNYAGGAIETKRRIVGSFVSRLRPSAVWDLGANTGAFSAVAANEGARVVAIEGDAGAEELHYRRLRAAKDERVLPLLVDLADPTPASGWANAERRSLADRGPADLVMALALVHHLTLGVNVPLARVADWLATLAPHALVEWVPPEDPQARRLVAHRPEPTLPYTRGTFDEAFGATHHVRAAEPVGESGRTILLLERRTT